MNFWMLKNMVENLVGSYKCPFCSSTTIDDKNIDIVWAAGNTVNIDMHCPSCDKHFMAKTEVMQVELWNLPADKISKLQQSLKALGWKLWGNLEIEIEKKQRIGKKEQSLQDKNITSLHKKMSKKDMKVEDLFSEE